MNPSTISTADYPIKTKKILNATSKYYMLIGGTQSRALKFTKKKTYQTNKLSDSRKYNGNNCNNDNKRRSIHPLPKPIFGRVVSLLYVIPDQVEWNPEVQGKRYVDH